MFESFTLVHYKEDFAKSLVIVYNSRSFRTDCPTGDLSKQKIKEMYRSILPAGNAKVIFGKIFGKRFAFLLEVFASGEEG